MNFPARGEESQRKKGRNFTLNGGTKIDLLPSEVIHIVEQYLPCESIRNFSIVNKSIYSLIYTDAHWKEIYTQRYICPYYYMEPSVPSLSSSGNENAQTFPPKSIDLNSNRIQHRNIQKLTISPSIFLSRVSNNYGLFWCTIQEAFLGYYSISQEDDDEEDDDDDEDDADDDQDIFNENDS